MLEEDLDDTHLCIKCSATIVGLDNYVQHRKTNCVAKTGTRSTIVPEAFASFSYQGSSGYAKNEVEAVGGKTSKSLNDPYDLPYELGADIFFSSLQLQSVQASGSAGNAGKTSTIQQVAGRKVANSGRDETEGDDWQDEEQNNSDSLMKVVRDIGETKKYEPIFKPIDFVDDDGERSDDDDEDTDELDVDDDDDEDYVPTPYSGGKWKPGSQPSPPRTGGKWKARSHNVKSVSVPSTSGGKWHSKSVASDSKKPKLSKKYVATLKVSYKKDRKSAIVVPQTGGKWKPSDEMSSSEVPASSGGKWKPGETPSTSGKWKPGDSESSKIVPPTIVAEWDEPVETWEDADNIHPPSEYTKGKWVPGTKIQKLEYKNENVNPSPPPSQDFWCNICCRKLKTKIIFDKHLKSAIHLKKSETEEQLERAKVSFQNLLQPASAEFLLKRKNSPETTDPKKRKRRKTFVKCEICKHCMQRCMMGKHLISHYHYVRRNTDLAKSYGMVLDNIHQIVLQSPFQCSPCRFYANDEEQFLNHWNSKEHRDRTEGPGRFWCSFCRFECEDNNQMRRHLLGSDHQEVIMAINRSVPIIISKKVSIECPKCHRNFRYNIELRQHAVQCEVFKTDAVGTASDEYQSRFRCALCPDEVLKSEVALQRHEKFKHNKRRFYCSICREEFKNPEEAVKHRKTKLHRENSKAKLSKEKTITAKVDSGENLKCENCNHVSSSGVEAMLHDMSHLEKSQKPSTVDPQDKPKKNSTEESLRKCLYCKDSFPSKIELKAHLNTVHPDLKHICPLCGDAFTLPQELSSHRRYRICVASTSKKPPSTTSSQNDSKKSWNCSDCKFSSAYESELIFHRIIHMEGGLAALQSSGTKIKCQLCEKSFTKHSLRHHLRQHTNEKIYQCEICKRSFSRRSNYKDHMEYVHSVGDAVRKRKKVGSTTDEQFVCDTCGKIFKTNADGEYVVTTMTKAILHYTGRVVWTPPAIFKSSCEIDVRYFPFDQQTCFMKFGSWTYDGDQIDLKHINQKNDKDNKVEIGIDLREYYPSVEWDILGVPAERHEKYYPCCAEPYPGEQVTNPSTPFYEESGSGLAIRFEKVIAALQVKQCSGTHSLKTEEELGDREARGGEQLRRNLRGKELQGAENYFWYSLKLHINIHMERDRKFVCPQENCEYVGRNSYALSIHASSHEVKTDYKCQEMGCSYKGKSSYHLKRHMKSHLQPDKLYKCPECDFKAKIPAHIRRHVRIHTGECPYKCPHCDYSCGYIENLRKHVLTTKKHPGKFIYQCPDCDPKEQYQTNYNNEFQLHLTKVHGK